MKRFKTKKSLVAVLAVVALAIAAVGAYAYFTTTGSGDGVAAVGSDTPLTIVQTNTVSGLTPGGGSQSVAYTIDNSPSSNGVQNLGKVSITGITVDSTHATAGCSASWFSQTTATNAVGTIGAGSQYTSSAGTQPSIQMDNIASSQDACKGASLTFTLSAAQGS